MAVLTSTPLPFLPVLLLLSISTLLSLTTAQTSKTTQFTPAEMIGASRRGAAVPNAAGTLAFYTTWQYSFETHDSSYGVWMMNLTSGEKYLYSDSLGGLIWLDGNTLIWLSGEDDGSTSVFVGDATKPGAKPTSVGSIPGPVYGLELASTGNGTWNYAVTGSVAPDGTIRNPDLVETPLSSGRIYTTLPVRSWDAYVTPNRNSIWYGTLTSSKGRNGTTAFTISEPINALNGTRFDSNQLAVSSKGLAFIAADPEFPAPLHTKSDVWYIPLSSFTSAPSKPQAILTPGYEGTSSSLSFSLSSNSLIFLRMKDNAYLADKNRLFTVPDVTHDLTAVEFFATPDGIGTWDRSPYSIFYSKDGSTIFAVAEDLGHVRLWSLPSDPAKAGTGPALVFGDSGVGGVQWLGDDKLLVTSSSFIDNSIYSIVDPVKAASSNATEGITLISANLDFGSKWGLSRSQISEINFKGYGDYMVHAYVVKPSTFQPDKTYPLMYYIHGGPHGATNDAWSLRWNLVVWAEQGYVVVGFNPTGSTGFGKNYTDRVQNEWGGLPYQDLVLGWDYISNNLPFVDTTRAVAAGASYGGYMVNWIQGNSLGRKFRALFTHDGPFNTLAINGADDVGAFIWEFDGSLTETWDNYARWNPANRTDQWATPHLVVHGDLDYRVPISEGMATFNTLQERGVKSKMLVFTDENHWTSKTENSLVWHNTAMDWFNEHVGLSN